MPISGEHMSESVYRLLSQRLDALPNRFPATKSGVELRLLKKLFTLEEAALASVMSLVPEPVSGIAGRAGVDSREARNDLKRMTAKRKHSRSCARRKKPDWSTPPATTVTASTISATAVHVVAEYCAALPSLA